MIHLAEISRLNIYAVCMSRRVLSLLKGMLGLKADLLPYVLQQVLVELMH